MGRARRRALKEGYTHTRLFETFIKFQLGTAARPGETLTLRWVDIDWQKQRARVPTFKNCRPRYLSLCEDVLELLRQLPRSTDLVFAMTQKELFNGWRRICAAAGIENLRITVLRHEALSRAAESGLSPSVLDL